MKGRSNLHALAKKQKMYEGVKTTTSAENGPSSITITIITIAITTSMSYIQHLLNNVSNHLHSAPYPNFLDYYHSVSVRLDVSSQVKSNVAARRLRFLLRQSFVD